jgi:dynein heavy chain
MLKHEHPLIESGKYIVPAEGDVQSYVDYIATMSINDYTEVFGLNDNAEITSAINATTEILDAALSVQGAVAISAGAKTQDEVL